MRNLSVRQSYALRTLHGPTKHTSPLRATSCVSRGQLLLLRVLRPYRRVRRNTTEDATPGAEVGPKQGSSQRRAKRVAEVLRGARQGVAAATGEARGGDTSQVRTGPLCYPSQDSGMSDPGN